MKQIILTFVTGLFLINMTAFAQDIAIDESGNITTGTSNNSGNLKVTGASGEHGVEGLSSGTGAAGIYGKTGASPNDDYGTLGEFDGSTRYGVHGKSSGGLAGFFEGNTRVTGNLTVDGTLFGETDPTVDQNVKDGVDWTELTGIPAGFADGTDNTGSTGTWAQNGADTYYNTGNVGIGTSTPAGMLDVTGDICLGSVCRTTWPSGSGTGAFTDSGSSAYYDGGNVGIGTANPESLTGVDSRILHIAHSPAPTGESAAGLRLEVDGIVEGGMMSAYDAGISDGGLYIGTMSNHRLTLGTNSTDYLTITPGGHVGIGTHGALQPLHVQGNAYVYDKLGVGIGTPSHNLQVSGSSALFSSDTGDFRTYISKKVDTDVASLIFQDNFIGKVQMGLLYDDNFHIALSADGNTYTDAMVINSSNSHIAVGSTDTGAFIFTVDNNSGGPTFRARSVGENNGTAMIITKTGPGSAALIKKTDDEAGYGLQILHNGIDPALSIKSDTADLMVVETNGNVGIGTITPQGALDVNGTIYQRGGVLHADYVFEPNYKLESIEEHADFMWGNKHLEAIPKATRDSEGRDIIEVGSHRKGIVEELEKAHIYIEQLHKRLRDQNSMIQTLEERLTKIENSSK